MKDKEQRQQEVGELNRKLDRLATENAIRYNKMNSIAYDFFMGEDIEEDEARKEYQKLFYEAEKAHRLTMKLKAERNELSKTKD